MNKRLIYSLFISASLLTKQAFSVNEKISFRADFWCPYNCHPTDKKVGYMVEILQKAFGKENINYEEMNWARAIQESRGGAFDGIIGAVKDDAPDFIFAAPLGKSHNCFYTQKDNKFKYTGPESLKTIKLGIIKDYAYFEDLNVYLQSYKNDKKRIDENFGNDALVRMIKKMEAGRLDAIIDDPNVVDFTLKKHPEIKNIKEVGCKQIGDLHIAFSPKNPKSKERAEKLDKTIDEMIKSGEMDKLIAQYGLKPWYK